MRKKILYIVLLTVIMLTACGKPDKKEPTKTEQEEMEQSGESRDNQVDDTDFSEAKDEDSQSVAGVPSDNEVQEPSNQAESNTDSSNGTTTKPSTGSNNTTTKPSTGNTNNSGSGNTGNNNSGSNNTGNTNPNTGSTNNSNPGTTTQPVHEHNWVEVTEDEILYYAWRTICGKCKTDLTDMTSDDRMLHVAMVCGGSYANYLKEVYYVTDNFKIEPIVTGYKCECGATKNK